MPTQRVVGVTIYKSGGEVAAAAWFDVDFQAALLVQAKFKELVSE